MAKSKNVIDALKAMVNETLEKAKTQFEEDTKYAVPGSIETEERKNTLVEDSRISFSIHTKLAGVSVHLALRWQQFLKIEG